MDHIVVMTAQKTNNKSGISNGVCWILTVGIVNQRTKKNTINNKKISSVIYKRPGPTLIMGIFASGITVERNKRIVKTEISGRRTASKSIKMPKNPIKIQLDLTATAMKPSSNPAIDAKITCIGVSNVRC
jgi:hypothetical protein